MAVNFLAYKDIDKQQWDECIRNAVNGLIYGRSFYLDAMAQNWDGLVLDDYDAVMPLTWKTKWGISYLYQPAFIQQAGIFYTGKIGEKDIRSFIDLAMEHFKFAETTFNYGNPITWNDKRISVTERTNFVLDLSPSYEVLYQNYHPSFTKSLRRIKKFGFRYESSSSFHDSIELYKELYGRRLPFFSEKSYTSFELICKILNKERNVIFRDARTTEGELLASLVLLKDEKRLYNIISCVTSDGKTKEANYFLYDQVLREFAGSSLLLDFEGSDIKGIAAFYSKFNPRLEPYPFIRYNNLPKLVKIFKP